jgi:hypothetical protein
LRIATKRGNYEKKGVAHRNFTGLDSGTILKESSRNFLFICKVLDNIRAMTDATVCRLLAYCFDILMESHSSPNIGRGKNVLDTRVR